MNFPDSRFIGHLGRDYVKQLNELLIATLLFGRAMAKAEAVLDWNEIAVNTAIANGQAPIAQARYAAIVQLAVFEAVNAIDATIDPILAPSSRHTAPSRPPIRCSAPISRPAKGNSTLPA